MPGDFAPFEAKMRADGLGDAAVAAFKNSYEALCSGATGMIPESDLTPAAAVPVLADVAPAVGADAALLAKTVVLKLNGGLGTSMGLDYAKSLLLVKGADTFLDLTAKQIIRVRTELKTRVRFVLMNSFATSKDTMAFFKEKYPALYADPDLEFVQNKVPKIRRDTLEPALWPLNPGVEWCPPGHGDLYAALLGSGKLDSLLASGAKYLFVSNSDNLGATLDSKLLAYFAESKAPFMMECCERTANDKKGGHLAVRKADKQLILREAAQCPAEDEAAFQDITKHKYFNTNNLWIDLDALKALTDKYGVVPLPMIKNNKTVDPKDDASTPCYQLETAMGAAIECFAGASAVVVPRERFAPVKKCTDLLTLRSDAYATVNDVPVLAPGVKAAPRVDLDSKKYKLVSQLERNLIRGTPSLKECASLKIVGEVRLSSRNVFAGDVVVRNESDEPKTLPPGRYENTTVDLTAAPGLGKLKVTALKTAPIAGQKPGTSGVRKKTAVFVEGLYLHNFVQATLDAVKASGSDITCQTLLVGGDGRYYNDTAIQIITKIAVANGVRRVRIAKDGLCSTPAVSAMIREGGPCWKKVFGAFILTASHNPGGPDEDFGIKYNCENGGPAPEKLTDAIYANTLSIREVRICEALPAVDIGTCGETVVDAADLSRRVSVEVVDGVGPHLDLLETVFDMAKIKALLDRPDFSLCFDAMHGVCGPYARALLCDRLGVAPSCLLNCVPRDDFGGAHADPNLTYAVDLTKAMGVDRVGKPVAGGPYPSFGAASDGDGDRNMILGDRFFVTPSDSLAVLANNSDCIPFFAAQGGLKAVARSMPTSGAVDRVAAARNLALFETPTGWKFFGNLMDSKALFGGEDYAPFLCGEESFGTGSDHVREKDGLFAVLAWLQVLAARNANPRSPLVTVEAIVKAHWADFGRNYYCRYDYEGVDKVKATAMYDAMAAAAPANRGRTVGGYTIATADMFEYEDPVDGSVSKNQGLRFLMDDGSRVVFRLSGTAGSGATIRLYLEKYEPATGDLHAFTGDVMGPLVAVALELSDLVKITGRESPTVIT